MLRCPFCLTRLCGKNVTTVVPRPISLLLGNREYLGRPWCRIANKTSLQQSGLGTGARNGSLRCYSFSSTSTTSSFYTYTSPVINVADYFLNGADYRNAPKIPDFIGPVRIGRTADGRGRGLFVTQDVTAGDVLMVSNAFCATYNDNDKEDMCKKITGMIKASPRTFRQFCSLAGLDHQNEMIVPDVKLFDNSVPYHLSEENTNFDIDDDRIRHIIQVNSFSGKLTHANQPDLKFNGMWLLPSFMNHSCSPSASRNMVGEAMLFMAARDMKANEEITICYTDCLVPLQKREDILRRTGYGFLCECERCVLERSLQSEIGELGEHYHALYDKAADEVYAVATRREKGPFTASKELACVYDSLTKKVSAKKSLTMLQKQWILGGYDHAYLANFLTSGYTSDFTPPDAFVTPTAMELVKAMHATVPGMQRTLTFSVMLATIAPNRDDQIALVELAIDECIRMYGKQRTDILKKLSSHAVQLVPFF